MSNVSSLSSSIAKLLINILVKRGRKRKSDVEKADYKKRHTTYNKKRNFQLPITETQKSIHQKIEKECSACKSLHFADEYKSKSNTYDSCCSHGKFVEDKFNAFPLTLKELFMREHVSLKQGWAGIDF